PLHEMHEGFEEAVEGGRTLLFGNGNERLRVGVRIERSVGVLEAAQFREVDGMQVEADGAGEAAEAFLFVRGERLTRARPGFPAQVFDEVRNANRDEVFALGHGEIGSQRTNDGMTESEYQIRHSEFVIPSFVLFLAHEDAGVEGRVSVEREVGADAAVREIASLVNADRRAGEVAVADHEVGLVVAVDVLDRLADAAAIGGEAREEVGDRVGNGVEGAVVEQHRAIDDFGSRPATRPGTEDQIGLAVAVDVAHADVSTVAEGVVEGEEVADGVDELALGEGGAIVDGDARAAGEAGRDDEIVEAVAGHVAGSGAGPAAEAGVADAEEVRELREAAAVINLHARPAALVRRDDEIREAVVLNVPFGDEHAAAERVEWLHVEDGLPGLAVDHFHFRGDAGASADREIGNAVQVEI